MSPISGVPLEDTPAAPDTVACSSPALYSRRHVLGGVLGLAAAGCVAGILSGSLVGCATSSTNRIAATATPIIPTGPITSANAGYITRLATLQPGSGDVRAVAWSPDGRLLATGDYRQVVLWNSTTRQQVSVLTGHTGQIYALAWSAASGLLASACYDGSVRLWNTQRTQTVRILKGSDSLLSVSWSPDGARLVAGTRGGSVLLWDAQNGKLLATWEGPPESESRGGRSPFAAWGVSWSPDGRYIVSTRYDDFVLVWDVSTGKSLVIPETDTQPNTVAWSPDGRQFAVTDDQGKVILWDGATMQRKESFAAHVEAFWSYGLAWSSDSSMVACSRQTGIVQIWDVASRRELVLLQAHKNAVWGLAWSPDGRYLASASDDETACLWGVPPSA